MLTVSSSERGSLDHEVGCTVSIYQLSEPNIPDVTIKTFKFLQQTL